MKYLSFLLCAFIPFMHLQAKPNDTPKYYETYWSGTDDELFLVVKLDDTLMLPESYFPSSTANEISCKIICTPKEEAPFVEGSPYLQELQLLVTVNNITNPKKIYYKITTTKIFKEDLQAGGVRTTSLTETDSGYVTNPSIDLNKEAYLSLSPSDPQKGYIVFKNSYPFSHL